MTLLDIEKLGLNIKRTFRYIWFIIIAVLLYRAAIVAQDKVQSYRGDQRDAICPSLLSISRSARDTLIVMKAEPLCNSFVLENLK